MGSNAPGAVPRIAPWWGMALYLLAGAVWVAVGDGLLAHWVQDPHLLARWQTFKGWLYVAFTGVLAWWLLTRMRSAERARSALAQERVQIERHAPVGIARVEPAGMRFLSANERLCAWLELPPQAIVQRHFDELVAPDDRASAQRQLQQLLSGQAGHFQGERLCLRAGGGPPLPVLCTVSLVPAAQDEPAHLLCVLQDMGGINAARAALARSENILRLALDGSGSGMWDWDLAQRRITGSQGLLRLLRYLGPELPRGLNLLRLVHPEDRHRLHRAVQRAIAAGVSFDEAARLQRFDGSYCWFQARGQCHRDAQGRPERFSGILADLTDRRAAEERQRLASTVLDNAVEGVVVTDAYGCILSINPVVTRVLGYTEQELLGRNPRVFQSGRHDKVFYEAMWEAVRRTGHWQGEIWNRRKNGEIFPERMSLSAVRDAQGAVTHYVCMFSDISQEMAQHQRLEFLSHRDSLTGLPNRDWFVEQLRDAMCQALAHGEQMAVLLINLDRFKDVNDSYGHAVGDEVLRHITAQVRMSLRPGDLVGRMAGDEIAVLARNLRHSDGAAAVAQHLIAAASKPWRTPDGIEVVAGVSVGISMFPEHARTAEQLLQGAHSAVYGAKARGRGAHCFFDESMIQAARERLEIEARLRSALAQGHLRLYYQPQVHIATGRIVRRPGAGGQRPAGRLPGAGADRVGAGRAARGHAPGAAAPADAGGAHRGGRLRHRLLLAGAPQALPDRRAQDRPGLHPGHPEQRGRHGHQRDHHRHGAQPGPDGARRRRGDARATGLPARARLRQLPGLPVQPARAGRAVRRAAAGAGVTTSWAPAPRRSRARAAARSSPAAPGRASRGCSLLPIR